MITNHRKYIVIRNCVGFAILSISNTFFEESVTYTQDGETYTIPNDYVFAMIGYHPDYEFLQNIGIDIKTNEYGTAPVYDKETYETNVENCYIFIIWMITNHRKYIVIRNCVGFAILSISNTFFIDFGNLSVKVHINFFMSY